jgi:hypothetical protein
MIIAMGLASYISRSLPDGDFCGGRIQKHAALEQDAVHVGHHGAGVAARVAVALRPVEIALIALRKALAIALVDRVGLVAGGMRRLRSTRMKAPTLGSSTNMSTPVPRVSTNTVDEPYST